VTEQFVFIPTVYPDEDEEFFVKYMTKKLRTQSYIKIHELCEADLFHFLALFQGENIKVPNGRSLDKSRLYCRIYSFLDTRDFSEEAYELAAIKFGKRSPHLRRIVDKVRRELGE